MPPIQRHIGLLSDGNSLARGIEERLEAEGYQVELVDTVEDLSELMLGLSPHLVLVDASHIADLAVAGAARVDAQLRAHLQNRRIQLVAMGMQDSLQARLRARRAGVDAFLLPPFDVDAIFSQLQALLSPTVEDKLRVLVVEDDRAQALFAQSVLNNAGMEAEIENDPMHVLEAIEMMRPDLVLMDLHMPEANGTELTAMIRLHPTYRRMPIVFLSGENDMDARFEAIEAGGDDFLLKPIRPKHLIAAVQNRVRRVRDLETPVAAPGELDEATGLLRRQVLLDRVDAALGTGPEGLDSGGALYLEIEGTAVLRERFGLAALEHVLVEAGGLLGSALGERAIAARVQDKAFLVLATGLDDGALDMLAGQLRDGVMQHAYEVGGKILQLRVSVGICALRFGFSDANALLDTAELTCRDARASDRGIKSFVSARATELRHETAQVERLREAISQDGLGLIYQPIVAVQGGHDAQFQTLLRMRGPDGQLLPAADILPVAERGKLMIDIDRWVLVRAMGVVRRQRDSGRAVRLFVPQAMTTFTAKGQAEWLKNELSALEVAGSSLVLESRLEDALFNPPALQRFADAMREDGVRMCVGQYEHAADANRLLELIRPEFIKVAYKYVAPNAPPEARSELRGLIESAHRLGIEVIGSRVEDARSAATLWMSGIDFVQGNLVQGAGESLDFDFSAAVL